MKRCRQCATYKPLEAFYPHPQMADGHLNKCKDCIRRNVAARRAARLDEIRQYDRARGKQPERIARTTKTTARWRAQHPDRWAAQRAVANAVRSGKLTPWPVCAVPECDSKPEAHHPDYSRPLDVVWLCSPHHKECHAK